jgi:uncharacterized membrane protein HdeD (DUF308 family)
MNISRSAARKTCYALAAGASGLLFLWCLVANPLGTLAAVAVVLGIYFFFLSKERC